MTLRVVRPLHRGIGAPLTSSTSVQTENAIAALRRRRNLEIMTVLGSGAVGVASLIAFARGRFVLGYSLAAGSALVSALVTILRVSSEYDRQVAAISAPEGETL